MSAITLRNNTHYAAQYVLKKGEQIIARLPAIEPGAQMSIPSNATFEVIAAAVIDGNTYTSAALLVQGSMGFIAQVKQVPEQGTYEFEVLEVPSKTPNALAFQKTCLSTVTFTVTENGRFLQNIVVENNFTTEILDISDTFYVYAVINGITTDTKTFTNPSAIVTAITDNSDLEAGYFTLVIN